MVGRGINSSSYNGRILSHWCVPSMPQKIPGRTRPNRVLGPSYPRHCEEAGITIHFVVFDLVIIL